MGVSLSCPLATYSNLLKYGLGFSIANSILLREDQDNKMAMCSESKIMEPFYSDLAEMCSINEEIISQTDKATMTEMPRSSFIYSFSPKHEAALKLQKVYRSFRTRRKLADCAVLIDQNWWRLIDFAELKHSSISFFDIDKQETAISRWSRARTRAAKVGKGLSKNGKAQKLAIQHWLEAIDPRHRYGHNLHFYYVKWLHSQSKEPFFYWLDIGEGKEINLVEKCPRSKLQQQCVKYLGPMERKAYEVSLKDGILSYKETGELIDTTGEPKSKCIFVLSTSKILYIGKKKKGTFQHSSFLAGGAAVAAGRIVVENGVLKAAWPHSGHYRPTPENFQDFVSFLKENNIELNDVKLDVADQEETSCVYLANTSSEDDLGEKHVLLTTENNAEDLTLVKLNSNETKLNAAADTLTIQPISTQTLGTKLTLEIPNNNNNQDFIENVRTTTKNPSVQKDNNDNHCSPPPDSPTYEETTVLESTKGSKNYQLCGKWSSGAGPRIGILRDYPSELQSHALEISNLSPRSCNSPRFNLFSHTLTDTNGISTESRRSPLVYT